MTTYRAPVRDQLFILGEVLGIDRAGLVDLDLAAQVLEEGARFCEGVLAPLGPVGDKTGCRLGDDGAVTTPPGYREAYARMVEAGWPALSADEAHGGQGLPAVIGTAFMEMASAADMAFAMYPGLTQGAAAAIRHGGSDAQKALYLPKLVSGEWTGTMNLTEPQCGTDLGLIRTRAAPGVEGAYAVTGQKIWISSGEHDLAENIVHLVLARLDGAPAGVKGLSLFLVPKFIPDEAGRPGARNAVHCIGLEEKMGIHGNATCVMAYEGATGWLVGEANAGLKAMFVMMNEARLGVGVQGLAVGDAAYQEAAAFARERLQGRAIGAPANPDGPADPILVHPDVRRMLMDARAVLEGGRALLLWTAMQGDLQARADSEAERTRAADFMGLLTPVVKAYLTDQGFKAASLGMQVHGGSGFTEHFSASRRLRDARIAMIYEGTNGIQALDLIGRKLGRDGGRGVLAFFAEIDQRVSHHGDAEALKPFVKGLSGVKAELLDATLWLMKTGPADPVSAAAGAADYLELFALTALSYMWLRMAEAAQGKVEAGDADPFYADKLIVGRYFTERVLPSSSACLARMKTGAEPVMALRAEAF